MNHLTDYNREMQSMLNHMIRQRESYRRELYRYPPGSLWKTEHDGQRCYFWAYREGDVYVRRGISRDPDMQRKLARKAYITKSIKILDRNIYRLERTLDKFEPMSPDSVVRRLTKAYQGLPNDYFDDQWYEE